MRGFARAGDPDPQLMAEFIGRWEGLPGLLFAAAPKQGGGWSPIQVDPADPHPYAEKLAERNERGHDVYLTVSTQSAAPAKGKRATTANACALAGLWIDLDHAEGCHSDAGRRDGLVNPPNLAACLTIVDAIPHAPDLIVDTTGGLHAWWWSPVLIDDTNRMGTMDMVATWQHAVCETAAGFGWAADPSVKDLARVMRIPGSLNWKWWWQHQQPARLATVVAR